MSARYRLTKEFVETLATRGPVSFGDELPGFWTPGEANEAGGEDLGLAEQEIDARLKANPALAAAVEKVGKGEKTMTSAERRKLQLDAEPATADPTEALAEAGEDETVEKGGRG